MAAEAGPPPADCFMTELSGLLDGTQVRLRLALHALAFRLSSHRLAWALSGQTARTLNEAWASRTHVVRVALGLQCLVVACSGAHGMPSNPVAKSRCTACDRSQPVLAAPNSHTSCTSLALRAPGARWVVRFV